MNNKHEVVKKNLSSTQVLKTLRVLLEDDYSMSDLIQKLNDNEPEPIFNNSVISKYINTCRFCGIVIPKIKNKYFVSKIPFGMKISDEEHAVLQDIQLFARAYISKKSKKQFDEFIKKMSIYSDRDIMRVDNSTIDLVCSRFEKAIDDERKVKIILKSGKSIFGIPLGFAENKGKKCLSILCDDVEHIVMPDKIIGIEVTKEKFQPIKSDHTVLFKLTGALASNYSLRANETLIISNKPDYITVMNEEENNLALMNRLLRYGELCEVESPKYVRDEIKKIIKDALANYGEV